MKEATSLTLPTRAIARLRSAYSTVGLLVPLSLALLVFGGVIHSIHPKLPSTYTWLVPFDTLHKVLRTEGTPAAAILAYIVGVLTTVGFRQSVSAFNPRARLRASLALIRNPAPDAEQQRARTILLARVLAFVLAFALDLVFAEGHGFFDALAIGSMAAVVARPWSRKAVLRFVLYTACVALVFTAVCYWFTVIKALTFVGEPNRDAELIDFERAITGFYPHRWVAAWSSERPTWVRWFDWTYFRMFHHMALTAAFLIGLGDIKQRTDYLAALAICYMVGAPLYLTFPAAGPAFFEPQHYQFLREQALTVNFAHQAIYQNTAELNAGHAPVLTTWSYIACMPSLHLAHETVMLYYARFSKLAFALAFCFTAVTAVAVIALGWHYPTDIIAGAGLAVASIAFCRWQSARLLPRMLIELETATAPPRSLTLGSTPPEAGTSSEPRAASERRPRELHVEELLVVGFFLILSIAGLLRDTSTFQSIQHSRLTLLTLVGLPLIFVLLAARANAPALWRGFRDFWPVFAALAIYDSLKQHLHGNRITEWLGIAPKDPWMIRIDEALFGRVLPLWLDSLSSPAFSEVMWFFYVWVYYLAPVVALGLAYSFRRQTLFLRLRKALVIGLLGGYVGYLLVPVAGPLFTVGEQFTRPILTQPTLKRLVFDTMRYNWDCFPSLHTAIPWTLTLVAWSELKRPWRVVSVFAASGVTLSTVALRFHYGIDVIAGLAWAAVVTLLVLRVRFVREPLSLRLELPKFSRAGRAHRRRALLAMIFVGTGAAALLAEQAFEKLLGTLLGASTPAAAVVLAVYFAGLTTGAVAYGFVSRRVQNPLRMFALLELGIACWALFLASSYEWLIAAFAPLLEWGAGQSLRLAAIRGLIACVWILPPTTLMGASFPIMVDALESLRVPGKRVIGAFYSFNLLGAVAGAVLGPYLFFASWGVDGTLLFTALIDVCAGFLAFRLSRGRVFRKRALQTPAAGPSALPASAAILIGVAGASGFVLFSLEVVWTQLIAAVLGNSVYSFSAMLALVLIGLWVGGAITSLVFPRQKSVPVWAVAAASVAAALFLYLQSLLWWRVPMWFSNAGAWVRTFALAEIFRWATSALLLLPSAVALGCIYPALFRLREFPERERGRFAGWLVAANALGCISGALMTGFWLIPRFGSERSLMFFALVCALAGGASALTFATGRLRIGLGVVAAASLLAIISAPRWDRLRLTSGQHMYFARNQVWPESKLLFFHEDTHGGMTTVVENPAGVRGQREPYKTLLTNGKFQGNDAWERSAQIGITLIPLLYMHAFDQACVIGLGTGNSAHVAHAVGFRQIEIAEISPGIVEASRYFENINGGVLKKPNVHLSLEDARNLFLLQPGLRCDLITTEISSIWFAGSTNLYSREFYRLARSRLARGGIFQQWIQIHHIGHGELASVIATLHDAFPFVSFWVFGGQGILVAADHPLELSVEGIRRFIGKSSELGLDQAGAERMIHHALSSRLLAPSEVTAFVEQNLFDITINTDRNRYLEYASARYNVSQRDHVSENVALLAEYTRFPLHRLPPGWPEEFRALVRSAEPRRVFGPKTPQ